MKILAELIKYVLHMDEDNDKNEDGQSRANSWSQYPTFVTGI